MTDRFPPSLYATLAMLVLILTPVATVAQPTGAEPGTPRTAWGTPDLNGVWDFRTLTPFERPEDLADQALFTPEEAAQFEAERLAALAVRDEQEPADGVGNYNQFWFAPGNILAGARQEEAAAEADTRD